MGKRLSMSGVVVAVGLVGCGGGTTASTNAPRPKVTTTTQKEGRAIPSYPALASGAPCPRTPGGHATQTPIITLGHGPVYPIMGFPVTPPGAGGVVDYQGEGNGGRHPGGFWGTKVLIAVSPSYTGAFTVQGKQIDGPSPLDWLIENSQQVPKLSLPEGTGWRYYPTEALLQGAGCYALRIEGTSFSRLVVFKAVDDRTFRRLTKEPANPKGQNESYETGYINQATAAGGTRRAALEIAAPERTWLVLCGTNGLLWSRQREDGRAVHRSCLSFRTPRC